MTSAIELLKYQIALLGFATIARLAYYGIKSLLGNREPVSSWSEIRRIGSDLNLMSFGAIAAAMTNPNSVLRTNMVTGSSDLIVIPFVFLGLYALSYSLFRETAAPRPVFEWSWQNVKRVLFTISSFGLGLYAIGYACELAVVK